MHASTLARHAMCGWSPAAPSKRANTHVCMQSWKSEGIKGVWLKLPLQQAHLVHVATSWGFGYHHAEPEHLMLTTWLHDSPSTLPANASHQVGVGAVVPNRHGEILVLKEKSGPAAKYDIWKLPTGLLNAGEDYQDAAVREVKEETVRLLRPARLYDAARSRCSQQRC